MSARTLLSLSVVVSFGILAVILTVQTSHASPLGHEASFLGNSTARPGDIGASLFFPSATAFHDNQDLRIYSGLAYQIYKVKTEGFASNIDKELIPYFSATSLIYKDWHFNTFVKYSGTLNGQVLFSQNTLSGSSEIEYEDIEFGASLARKINATTAIGVSLSLTATENAAFTEASGIIDGNNALLTNKNKTLIRSLLARVSLSQRYDAHFVSASVLTPNLQISEKGSTDSKVLIENTSNNATSVTFEPRVQTPFGLAAGYHYDHPVWKPTVDLIYYFPHSYKAVNGTSLDENPGLSFRSYIVVRTGMEYLISKSSDTQYSLLAGISHEQQAKEKNVNLSLDEKWGYSLGLKTLRKTSQPIVGFYFFKNNGAPDSHYYGIMYSSNYNIFD